MVPDYSEIPQLADLTVGEVMAFEEITGLTVIETMTALESGEWLNSGTVVAAVTFLLGRRQFDEFTMTDAGLVPFAAIMESVTTGGGS